MKEQQEGSASSSYAEQTNKSLLDFMQCVACLAVILLVRPNALYHSCAPLALLVATVFLADLLLCSSGQFCGVTGSTVLKSGRGCHHSKWAYEANFTCTRRESSALI